MEPKEVSNRRQATEVIRILLVEDHPGMRLGLTAVLEADPALELVGDVDRLGAALTALPQVKPDLVIVDPGLPDARGASSVTHLRQADATVPLLVYSASAGHSLARDCLSSGANGFVSKTVEPRRLREAIRKVAHGEQVVNLDQPGMADEGPVVSPRELEALHAAADGLTNRQAARRMSCSEHTVKAHLASAMRKLEARDRAHAVAQAVRRGLF